MSAILVGLLAAIDASKLLEAGHEGQVPEYNSSQTTMRCAAYAVTAKHSTNMRLNTILFFIMPPY
jgi:hypothetical protein